MIEVTGLYKKYGTRLAVENVSFSIQKGEVVGFLGPNGAGKSTIMNILTGYLSLTAGSVKIDGFDISESPEKAKARIGYLPEIPPLYIDMKVGEYLYFIYDLKKVKFPKKPHIEEIMRLVGITAVQNRLIKNLSKGFRQRVGFAAALVGNPDVLILDEPTVGLDPKQIIEIRNLIERLGKNHTIILSSHILSEIQAVCKRVLIINKGTLIADGDFDTLSKGLLSDGALGLTVSGDESAVLNAIRALESIKNVKSLGKKGEGIYEFEILPQEGADVRESVFDATVSAGAKILEFKNSNVTLEEIFLRLTENSDNEDAIAAFKRREIVKKNEALKKKAEEKEVKQDESNI